jgi:acetoin utilization deacetylase AcuC-like enzyme
MPTEKPEKPWKLAKASAKAEKCPVFEDTARADDAAITAVAAALYSWQCAICLEQQPLTRPPVQVTAYCAAVARYAAYSAACTSALARREPPSATAIPLAAPLLSAVDLSIQRCRDCGSPGLRVGAGRAVDDPLLLVRTLLGGALRQAAREEEGESAAGGGDTEGVAQALLMQRGITADVLDTLLAAEPPMLPLRLPAREAAPFGLSPRPTVGLAFHRDCLEHASPVPYPITSASVAEEEEEERAERELSGRSRRPRAAPETAPERPDRLLAAAQYLVAMGLWQACVRLPTVEATDEQLLSAVSRPHLQALIEGEARAQAAGAGAPAVHTGDTYWCGATLSSARRAAGCVLASTSAVLEGHVERAIALVRPPGHHASPDCSRGFCVANSVALAAKYAADKGARVLIVDWDIHHGDGTESVFYDDPRVLVISVHRYDGGGYYPGTGAAERVGEGAGAGYNVNIPLDGVWHGNAEYCALFESLVLPIARAFAPSLILVSAGWDAARGDYLGDFDVTPDGYAVLTHALLALGAPIVVAMEGGYNLAAIAACTAAVTRVLLGEAPRGLAGAERAGNAVRDAAEAREGAGGRAKGALRPGALEAMRRVATVHAPFWPCVAHAATHI